MKFPILLLPLLTVCGPQGLADEYAALKRQADESPVHSSADSSADSFAGLYAPDNLVAWCIVPFDAAKRTPAERAAMLRRLNIGRVAYDWRQHHIPEFEDEILQYKKQGLEYFAFWSWHPSMEPLITKHGIRPQIWQMLAQPKGDTQQERVAAAAAGLLPLVETTKRLGCSLGIYNHGGWSGEPENMTAVVRYLRRQHDASHVGIVYNFHHGHEHIDRFPQALKLMMPYLLCVNINGMVDADQVANGKKIVPVGSGQHEVLMLRQLQDSGYRGRIGILDHRSEIDAEKSLRQNLKGLESLRTAELKRMGK